MPYVKPEQRKELDEAIETLSHSIVANSKDHTDLPGNLNYCITRLIMRCFKSKFGVIKYWMIAMIDGVLENVQREFYRRVASPYEDQKIQESGDVEEYKQ